MSFFCSRIPFKMPYYIYSSCPLRLLLATTISQLFLPFDDFDSVKVYRSDIFV